MEYERNEIELKEGLKTGNIAKTYSALICLKEHGIVGFTKRFFNEELKSNEKKHLRNTLFIFNALSLIRLKESSLTFFYCDDCVIFKKNYGGFDIIF